MTLAISAELKAKLASVGDHAILDSVFSSNSDGSGVERVQGTLGVYISSEADGWQLRGPFGTPFA